MKHPIAWQAPSPLWRRILAETPGTPAVNMDQPALLRFASDTFMEDLRQVLEEDPSKMATFLARPETWRQAAAGWPTAPGPSATGPLKLYQASHGRFYLVTASLVCRLAGLPDRKVDTAAEERVSFVVRRLVPSQPEGTVSPAVNPENPASFREAGWFGDRTAGAWQALASASEVDPREERLPLFPMGFDDNSAGGHLQRRFHAGLIPVGAGETYAAGTTTPIEAADLASEPTADPRMAEFLALVATGLRQLAELSDAVSSGEAREVLAFTLVDFAGFLRRHHSDLWYAVENGGGGGLSPVDYDVFQHLGGQVGGHTWRALLADAGGREAQILAGNLSGVLAITGGASRNTIRQAATELLDDPPANALVKRLRIALAARPPVANPNAADSSSQSPAPGESPAPAADGAFYVLRCVYERPRCRRYEAPKVSAPSAAFQLASYFDPDAPVRPLRISLPVDTSAKGLRRFPKGVSVLLSNQLRRQVQRVSSATLGELDEGAAGNDSGLPNLGLICSLSIPIITICAFILLMIIVNLLNIVFWWKPLFKICFPLRLKS